ncbi:14935_t:CDS:2, partial [Gigaspora rosea]
MREQYMHTGEGFLFVYSITSPIVVANNCDLEMERQVSEQEGRELAKQLNCKFIETSAKQRINVDEAFYNFVREIRKYNKEQQYGGRNPANPGSGNEYTHEGIEEGGGCCVV